MAAKKYAIWIPESILSGFLMVPVFGCWLYFLGTDCQVSKGYFNVHWTVNRRNPVLYVFKLSKAVWTLNGSGLEVYLKIS